MIEAVLKDKSMTIDQFSNLYRANPAQMYKAVVKDRTKFKVTKDETRLIQPVEL